MRLLTATIRTQGRRPSDFTWCVEGELVTNGAVICDRDRLWGPDGGCGCGRSFAGLHSAKSTTTAMVRDLDFSRADLETAIRGCREDGGWDKLTDDFDADITEDADAIITAAARFPVGAVLETRMGNLGVREVRAS
jgi:hypothetical protein